MIELPNGNTPNYFGSDHTMLRVRAVLECAGVKNAVSKSLGAKSGANVAKATLQALMNLHLAEDIYEDRGLKTPKPKAPILLKFLDLNTRADPMQSN